MSATTRAADTYMKLVHEEKLYRLPVSHDRSDLALNIGFDLKSFSYETQHQSPSMLNHLFPPTSIKEINEEL
jgi:hypothetical protein